MRKEKKQAQTIREAQHSTAHLKMKWKRDTTFAIVQFNWLSLWLIELSKGGIDKKNDYDDDDD